MSEDQYAQQDPRTQYDQPSSSDQQEPPGLTTEMRPRPDHGEDTYRGSERLVGRKAIMTGGDSGSGGRWRSRSPARAPTY